MVADLIAVQKNKQALRREWNKVEVFEGKFRSLKVFFVLKKETNFYMSHVWSKLPHMCSRNLLKENLHSHKKDSVPNSWGPCTTTLLHSVSYYFVSRGYAGFYWMRAEVADNWFAVVGRFAASNLRMFLVGQTGCICWFRREALPYREEM